MPYDVGVEDMEPEHWVAYLFDLPGCFSSGKTFEQAVEGVPDAIVTYLEWRGVEKPRTIAVNIREVFRSYPSPEDQDYLINAFFEDDRRPLTHEVVAQGLELLKRTRRDLLKVVQNIAQAELYTPIPGEKRNTVAGILEHLAQAELWYLDSFGLADWKLLQGTPLAKVEQSRAQTHAILPGLMDDDRVVTRSDETWSARKILRRTLWHERDHTQHIQQWKPGER